MQRQLGIHQVNAIGLGCMNLSHAYGVAPEKKDAVRLLQRAVELGVTHFDTAALYGFGRNECLVGEALKPYRQNLHLASKCGMTGVDGKRVIDGRPETLMRTIETSLKNLQTEHIDLYYLHRWDKSVPIEDSVGALSRMVEQGKIGAVGLSEVSADTLKKANQVHPITALQTEYSLWTRNPEIAVLDACRELGVTFVAFSPLARGFLSGGISDPSKLVEKDIRVNMPRFQEPNFSKNLKLFDSYKQLADGAGCTPGQLALAWLLAQGEDIVPIPGTRSVEHLEENLGALELTIDKGTLEAAGEIVNQLTVNGPRYPEATQAEIDTEEFG
jgi:aryl-alcohol dehydrogenase-like predicted oxidoreductase